MIIELNNKDTFDLLFKDIKSNQVFVDVGAYNGDTVKRANQNLKIIAIEPIKSLSHRIEHNKNITVINKACWNKKETLKFYEYEGWSNGLSTLNQKMTYLRPYPQFTNNISEYNIEADTLDNILTELNINTIDYLKIDTEGSEEQVLTGFTKYHKGTRFHIESHVTNLENILYKLLEMGAEIEKVTLARDGNIKEHIVGAVIGEFNPQHDLINCSIINETDHAGNSRIKFLIDNAIKNKEKILNIGCADNFMFKNTPDLDVMNIDTIDEIEDKSRTKFQICDAHKLSFNDNEFNCSILGDILEHVKDPIKVLSEAKRVSKNVYITVPNEYEWAKELNPFGNPAHVRYYTYESLKHDLDEVFGKDTTKIIQFNGSGWSFFCASYEDNNIQLTKNNKLRIALISTPFFTVPPKGYSGLEQIVWDLAEGLDNNSHEVTIFAPEGSQSTKHGHIVYTGKSVNTTNVNWFEEERKNYDIYKNIINSDKFDIVHGHTWFGFEYLLKINNPKLKITHTHHGGYSWESAPPFHEVNLIAISKYMKLYTDQYFKQFNVNSNYVYNGINLDKYPYQESKNNFLLYVGRLSQFKQPHITIDLAERTNHKLDIVGGTFVDSIEYVKQLDERIKNNPNINIYKDVTHEFKIEKMQNAKALIFPSKMGEPFGLVALEAMACGTPVIAFNDGAISEVVIHNKTGFICNTFEDMIEAVKKIDTIKPEDCRKRAEEFSREFMAKNYENLYNKIITEK